MANEAQNGSSLAGLRIRWEDEACVLEVSGELDLSTQELLCDGLSAIAETECEVIVDLSEVSFADCAGLAPLLQAASLARPRGRSVRFRSVPPTVERVLELTDIATELSA